MVFQYTFHERPTTSQKKSTRMNIQKDQLFGIGPNSKLLQQYKAQLTSLSPIQKEIAIGLCLGDASLQQQSRTKPEYRMKFEWGDVHKEYAFHVYETFSEWILSPPALVSRNHPHSKKAYNTWRFQTISHQAFSPLADLLLDPEGKKCILPGLVRDHLTARGLAFWFMDDGGLAYKGRFATNLHTQGFQPDEVQRLCEELSEKFGLICWPKKNKRGFCIVISGKSYLTLREQIVPWVIQSMHYKLPIRGLKSKSTETEVDDIV